MVNFSFICFSLLATSPHQILLGFCVPQHVKDLKKKKKQTFKLGSYAKRKKRDRYLEA